MIETIKGLPGEWAHFLESTWLTTCALSPDAIVDELKPFLDPSDRLLVINVAGDTYQGWMSEAQWKWIRERW